MVEDSGISQSEKSDDDSAELMFRIADGDHNAFTTLVRRHTQNYFALAYRTLQNQADAEDVVQTVFIKLWQNPSSWQPGKSRFTTWFYRVVLNACYDQTRKSKKFVQQSYAESDLLSHTLEYENEELENSQNMEWRQSCLEIALSKLPASQRDAINLVVYSELQQQQAADIMGVSLKALESLLIRAKRSLKKRIKTMQVEQSSQTGSLVRAAGDR